MSTPKMRQFKQILVCLQLWNCNVFFDGKKLEFSHQRGKNKQTKNNNHKQAFKTAVTNNDAKNLQMSYALGGGRWGNEFQYSLGEACLSLKDPKNVNMPNPAMKHFLIPRGIGSKCKIHPSQYFGDKKKGEEGAWRKQDPMSYKSSVAINSIIEDGHLAELMLHINSASPPDAPDLTWRELQAHPFWNIKKISAFRFFNHQQSFSMTLGGKKTSIVKTTNNHVFKFKNAYRFKYRDDLEIILAFGILWPIHASATPHNWLNDTFDSMDYVDMRERKNSWYFCTNFLEPVFLLHKCVTFDQIRHTLPRSWRSKNSEAFYHNYAFNKHQLMLDKDEYHCSKIRRGIQLPCGPIFKCKRHSVSRCQECSADNNYFDQKQWKMKFHCNKNVSSHFRVLDSKNGLHMTLMKTVKKSHNFIY